MEASKYASKAVASLILTAMFSMYLCSATCAFVSILPQVSGSNASHHACCKHQTRAQSHSCDDQHRTFFKATGQRTSLDQAPIAPLVPVEAALDSFPRDRIAAAPVTKWFASNDDLGSPPKAGIRTFILSFQI